jgi:N-acetylneuraminic acid mutarotase
MRFSYTLPVFLVALAIMLSPAKSAFAHFIWIINDNGTIQVYFSESCTPGEPEILSKAASAKVWAINKNMRSEKPIADVAIALKDGQLSAKTPENVGAIGLSHDYGIFTRGENSFMLRYYAKSYAGPLPGDWREVSDAERLPLEVTPKWNSKELQLKVVWRGRPAKDAEVNISGCGIEAAIVKTDESGVAVCKPTASGILSVWTKQEEKAEGMFEGKPYSAARSYSTLSLPVEVPSVAVVAHALPDLDKGITSFGAAIAGDDLYIYGGHFGTAHHYSTEGQSNELRRISLTNPQPTWETLAEGPKLTGLALVSHAGKLYRVGGFTAMNSGEDSKQDLQSQSSFAVYDPKKKTWTELAPLPEGRSSHDAAVLDGKLYVAGGWKLAGEEPSTWHKTALVCDLNSEKPTWEEIASPPFKRRALSVAAYKGKIYAIGGMQESGGPTTRVDCYDPATREWSTLASLLGGGMDGFGTSSFANNDALVVTTMSGSIQRLSADGKKWELVGQMQNPRFFHRELVASNGDLLIVGGASMETGKVNSFERFKIEK